jgi:predicted RNA-binding Zn ribbon-like protein
MQPELAGKLCLAFADTARAADKYEELHGIGDLLQWATKAGVLSPTDSSRLAKHYEGNRRQAAADLASAVGVRDLLRSIFTGVANGRPLRDRDIAGLNSALAQSDRLARIRECSSAECTMLFVDESRNSSRRWCDMNSCGNRMKARRHYARTRKG